MKTRLIFLSLAMGLLIGCRSTEDTVEPAPTSSVTAGTITPITSTTTTTPGSTTNAFTGLTPTTQGTFMNNIHSVVGTVNVFEKDGKRTLVFKDFKSDGGPDLRIYLAENTGLRNFIEVTKLENSSGNFSVELPASADPSKQRYVLIWCKAFSVLFGNAELK